MRMLKYLGLAIAVLRRPAECLQVKALVAILSGSPANVAEISFNILMLGLRLRFAGNPAAAASLQALQELGERLLTTPAAPDTP